MKIAVIQRGGSVGAGRWNCAVCGAIKKYYPDTEITVVYYDTGVQTGIYEILGVLKSFGLQVKLQAAKCIRKKYTGIKLFDNIINHIKKKCFSSDQSVINFLNSSDIVIDTWPFSESIEVKVPRFFVPHDFIFTHYFGHHVGNVYNRELWLQTRNFVASYLEKGYIPCVTTNYIVSELRRTFPHYQGDVGQVLVVPGNSMQILRPEEISSVMARFEINYDYILLATNDMHHKNSATALAAYYYVKQKYPDLKMIIVGYGTQGVRVKMNCPYYADHVEDDADYDIKSLGLVSDLEIRALIQNAKVLLNVSLCEAGCGSGLDAWFLGTPTAISEIPPYKEQVETLGVKTEFFNPRNSEDVAQALLRLLDNPEYAQENARQSKEALNTKYTDKDMADNYMNIFLKYMNN